ncbi:OmpA family protein [Helicobacter felis]|uniref:Peptidoglycan-associated lipoprotein n=1 Tax=Helicobacter felis (strain ATCC 49179 / CCUG 28539 / NCTC 12436 / CS1) TaxID=936155 RepID=E7AAN6_HELFC|nr:OmpA family protein [Helicobacter felis]CBY83556.1 peptidoglycan-associated lipoprotein [Helicobacter felis ATCC 49179]
MNKWLVAGTLVALLVATGCGSKGAKPSKPPKSQSAENVQEQPTQSVKNTTVHPEGVQESTPAKSQTPQTSPISQTKEGQPGTAHELETQNAQKNANATSETVPAPQEPQSEQEQFKSGEIVGQVYFDFDKYNVRPDMQDAVDQGAQKIQDSKMKVLLEGNTDEFGTGEYNFALGNKRALSVKEALVVKGIAQDNIRTISFGESKPICLEKTKECYQKNRRVDIKVVQ